MKKRLVIFSLVFIFLLIILSAIGYFWFQSKKKIDQLPSSFPTENTPAEISVEGNIPTTTEQNIVDPQNNKNDNASLTEPVKPPPPPVSMDRAKTQGCVADGLLTEYNPENFRFVDLINRSKCYYLHRAIETWLKPPNFDKIQVVMNQISKPDIVYGMFIAEALDTKANYYNEEKKRNFDFSKMCRKGSDNIWGEHTCQPAFSSPEYRDYLKQITRRAIDLGVQSFTFGQIYWQEGSNKDYAYGIVQDLRSYANQKGVDIIVGAQTGAITDTKYLQLFDYIEGGVGIDANGNIERGACLSRKQSCWALLWNKTYASKAKNIFLHLDWTGIIADDLDVFARMSPQKRALTLQNLYTFFTNQKMGFLMPFFGVLDKNNGGCYGPKKKFYSPDNNYSCRDEDVINRILAD